MSPPNSSTRGSNFDPQNSPTQGLKNSLFFDPKKSPKIAIFEPKNAQKILGNYSKNCPKMTQKERRSPTRRNFVEPIFTSKSV